MKKKNEICNRLYTFFECSPMVYAKVRIQIVHSTLCVTMCTVYWDLYQPIAKYIKCEFVTYIYANGKKERIRRRRRMQSH